VRQALAGLCLVLTFGALLPAQPVYTHFITPTGVSTGACPQSNPCNSWWLTQLTAAQLPPGSHVHIADGYYSNGGALDMARNGTATQPIRVTVDPGALFSGGRIKPSVWTKTAGYTYIYETVWDEAAGGSPGGFAAGTLIQRTPTTWQPIFVDDRKAPYTPADSRGRPFWLLEPPPYKLAGSLALVDAQSGTWLASHVANRIYVHMYHDGPPTDGDDLHVGYANGGAWHITGDYWEIDGLRIHKTSGTGLWVKPSAHGTVIRNLVAVAAQVWLEGTNTLAEDLDISHVIKQGPPTESECAYDVNPAFGVGECWHAAASGQALIIGRDDSTISVGQVVRRARIHRSWNGIYLHAANTLEGSSVWGLPNHAMLLDGTGAVVRGNILLNAQDSLYMAREPYGDITIEHNVFHNAVLFWVNNNGYGGTVPAPWRFRYNILSTVSYDDKTIASVTADCNVYIPRSAGDGDLISVTPTDANQGPDVEYDTLAAAQAALPQEAQSRELAASAWTAGPLFLNFVNQMEPVFDFANPLRVCGTVAGPDGVQP
jgi:hypothetical protein